MGFLKKIFGKKNDEISEHEVKVVEDLVSKQEENFNEDENNQTIDIDKTFENNKENFERKYEKIFAKIKFEDINQIRNFLDKKEFELFEKKSNGNLTAVNSSSPLEEKLKKTENEISKKFRPEEVSEINIEEHITQKDLETKTYSEEEKEVSGERLEVSGERLEVSGERGEIGGEKGEGVKESDKEVKGEKGEGVKENSDKEVKGEKGEGVKENSDKEVKEEKGEEVKENSCEEVKEVEIIEDKKEENLDIVDEIKNIFGEENYFFEEGKKSIYKNINSKNIKFIGIRNKEGFKDNSHWEEQNKWFVENIKKLKELKSFKVLKSEEGLKDLVYNIDNENTLILSFRTTNLLKDENSFDFPFLN